MSKIKILFVINFLIFSCKKGNYIEEQKIEDTLILREYRYDNLYKVKVLEKNILKAEFLYGDDNNLVKSVEYYPNKKIKMKCEIQKNKIDYYIYMYHENGVLGSEGSANIVSKKDYFDIFRKGKWIYYFKKGGIYNISEFTNDRKNEYLFRELVFDTIKKEFHDIYYETPKPVYINNKKNIDILIYPIE